jgi:hypothetical protein
VPSTNVTYTWNGSGFTPSGAPPPAPYDAAPVEVRLQPG